MTDPVARRTDRPPQGGGPSTSRLEGWLTQTLQGGALRALPSYVPLTGCGRQCPEQYARTLLTGLRSCVDHASRERLKDDGRAFRSWAELALLHVSPRGGSLSRGILAN